MEHSIHLGAGHFIAGIAPPSQTQLVKKLRQCQTIHTNDSDDYQMPSEDEGSDRGDEEGDEEEFDVGNAIGKALALVQQVCHCHCCCIAH